jgi:TolB protein
MKFAQLAFMSLAVGALMVGCAPTPTPQVKQIKPQGSILFTAPGENNVFNLFTMDADGYNRKQITKSSDAVMGGRISPDKQQIVASIEFDKFSQLYVMNADGSFLRRLRTPQSAINPAWSPDNKVIAFAGGPRESENDYHIYLIGPDGNGLRQLTKNGGSQLQPAWSPDGKLLAYISNQSGTYQLYVMDVTGKGEKVSTIDTANYQTPAWSHDGKQLAFAADPTSNYEIYALDLTSKQVKTITSKGEPCTQPTWSPDDKLIAFSINAKIGFRLHLVTAEGKSLVPIDLESGTDEFFPQWY